MLACDYGLSPSGQIYCRSGDVNFPDVWGMFIAASSPLQHPQQTLAWEMICGKCMKKEKLASAKLFRVKSWPGEGNGSSGLGLKDLKGFFVAREHSWILSAHTMAEPEGPSKILQDSPDLEKETLRMQIKTPQNKKNSRSVLLVLDASPLPALLL